MYTETGPSRDTPDPRVVYTLSHPKPFSNAQRDCDDDDDEDRNGTVERQYPDDARFDDDGSDEEDEYYDD